MVHELTDLMTAVLGYLELEEYDKALRTVKDTIKHLHKLARLVASLHEGAA